MVEIKESLKKAIDERLSSPLFGYVILSWVAFNWKGLAVLFMSKIPVEERIRDISQMGNFSWFFWWPLLIGSLLAILSPYLHLALAKAHHKSEIWRDDSLTAVKRRAYWSEGELAKEKARASHAESLEIKREETRGAILEARRAKIVLGVSGLESREKKLRASNRKLLTENLKAEHDIRMMTGIVNDAILHIISMPDSFKEEVYGLENFERLKAMLSVAINYREMADSDGYENEYEGLAEVLEFNDEQDN